MEIKYDIEIPKSDKDYINELFSFYESEHMTMCMTFENSKMAASRSSSLINAVKRNKMNVSVKRIGQEVYLEKKGVTKDVRKH